MVNTCCDCGCSGNYYSFCKAHVLKFPNGDELWKSWIRSIPRANLRVSDHSVDDISSSVLIPVYIERKDAVVSSQEKTEQVRKVWLYNPRLCFLGNSVVMEDQFTAITLIKDLSSERSLSLGRTILARLVYKSNIFTFDSKTEFGEEGTMMKMDFVDKSGEIRATAYNELAEEFYNRLEQGKIYLISNCSVKRAEENYATLTNTYDMNFTKLTKVVDVDAILPKSVTYNFETLEEVRKAEPSSFHDVVGICLSTGELKHVTSSKDGNDYKLREIELVDQTGTVITLVLWGEQAEHFDGSTNPVIVIKNARVNPYDGRFQLDLAFGSSLRTDLELSEVSEIRSWYQSLAGETVSFRMI